MKKFALILLLLLFISALFSCSNNNPDTEYKYSPKTVLITSENQSGFHKETKNTYKYDSHGNIIKEEAFTKSLVYVRDSCFDTEYTYDENGRITKEITFKEYFSTQITDSHFAYQSGFDYQYDGNNRLIQKNVIYFGEHKPFGYDPFGYRYEYDSNGNLAKEIGILVDGSENVISEYTYNSDNILIQKTTRDDMLYHEYTYEYNSEGRLINQKQVNHYPNSNVESTVIQTFQYNEKGMNTYSKKSFFDKNGEVTSHTEYLYSYDELGRLIREETRNTTDGSSIDSSIVKEYTDFAKFPYRK